MQLVRLLLVLLGCLHLGAGPYGVAQIFAWTAMAVDYSAEKGLETGLRETFDGKHPCERCLAIAEDKKEDSSRPQPNRSNDRPGPDHLLAPEPVRPASPRWKDLLFAGFPDPTALSPSPRPAPERPPPRFV